MSCGALGPKRACPTARFQVGSADSCIPIHPHYCQHLLRTVLVIMLMRASLVQGTYASSSGLKASAQCTTCPTGSSCSEGSRRPRPCPPGRFAASSTDCALCPKGHAQPLSGQTQCARCPPGEQQLQIESLPLLSMRATQQCTCLLAFHDTIALARQEHINACRVASTVKFALMARALLPKPSRVVSARTASSGHWHRRLHPSASSATFPVLVVAGMQQRRH